MLQQRVVVLNTEAGVAVRWKKERYLEIIKKWDYTWLLVWRQKEEYFLSEVRRMGERTAVVNDTTGCIDRWCAKRGALRGMF